MSSRRNIAERALRAVIKIVLEESHLHEKRWADLNAPKGQTIPLTPEDFERDEVDDIVSGEEYDRELADEIFDLVQIAYSDVSIEPGKFGNIKVQSPDDLPAGYTLMKAADIDADPGPDYFRGGKMRSGKYKMGIVGHDGSPAAIQRYLDETATDLTSGGMAEMSGKIATVMITRYGVPAVTSKEQVEALLGKSVNWVGRHPTEKYAKKYGPSYEGWYTRGITGAAGGAHMKILLGS